MTDDLRQAFDSDSVPLKNIALRKAADRIEQLEAALDDLAQYVPRADINNLKHETIVALAGGTKE